MSPARHTPALRPGGLGGAPGAVARLLAAAGLAVDAWVHARLAEQYDAVSAWVSQGTLFRLESALACLAAVLVLFWRRRLGDALAWLVAAGGLALLLVYRFVDVGSLGPVPDMYEPIWNSDKTLTVAAQGVTVLATTYLLLRPRRHRTGRTLA
ncbi:hypothetical protein ACFV3R_00975 [Streptomyces sp. NPDC059740]|uniref:hypothetical protein n=1 Tax=Streptomyces sp. NPDC059740 TaxID=3346926 RepID=UPI00365D9C17